MLKVARHNFKVYFWALYWDSWGIHHKLHSLNLNLLYHFPAIFHEIFLVVPPPHRPFLQRMLACFFGLLLHFDRIWQPVSSSQRAAKGSEQQLLTWRSLIDDHQSIYLVVENQLASICTVGQSDTEWSMIVMKIYNNSNSNNNSNNPPEWKHNDPALHGQICFSVV